MDLVLSLFVSSGFLLDGDFKWLLLTVVGMVLLTIDDVAERLKCSDDQVRVLINSNQLPHVNIGAGNQRRCIRVSEDQLTEFLRRRHSDQPQPRRRPAPKPQREWV